MFPKPVLDPTFVPTLPVINELPMFPTGPLIVKRTKEADAPKGGGV
jgi:hypothetical protein